MEQAEQGIYFRLRRDNRGCSRRRMTGRSLRPPSGHCLRHRRDIAPKKLAVSGRATGIIIRVSAVRIRPPLPTKLITKISMRRISPSRRRFFENRQPINDDASATECRDVIPVRMDTDWVHSSRQSLAHRPSIVAMLRICSSGSHPSPDRNRRTMDSFAPQRAFPSRREPQIVQG